MEKIFEHEVALDMFSSATYTRKEIWEELVKALSHPSKSIETIESEVVTEAVSDNGQPVLERELDFGNVKVHDSVKLDPEKSALITIPHHEQYPESMHRITLLEPTEGRFGFKFEYYEDTTHPVVKEAAPYAQLRYQAWQAKDIHFTEFVVSLLKSDYR